MEEEQPRAIVERRRQLGADEARTPFDARPQLVHRGLRQRIAEEPLDEELAPRLVQGREFETVRVAHEQRRSVLKEGTLVFRPEDGVVDRGARGRHPEPKESREQRQPAHADRDEPAGVGEGRDGRRIHGGVFEAFPGACGLRGCK